MNAGWMLKLVLQMAARDQLLDYAMVSEEDFQAQFNVSSLAQGAQCMLASPHVRKTSRIPLCP